MKINVSSNDFDGAFDYEDFEILSIARPGIQRIHPEARPSMQAYEQQKWQNAVSEQTIQDLCKMNDELQIALQNERIEKIYFHHKIILQDFFVYLNTRNSLALKSTLNNIEESIRYFENVYKISTFEEIANYYLDYTTILSFFEEELKEDEAYRNIKDYCFNTFKSNYIQNLSCGKENFNILFNESIKHGNQIYSQFAAKNPAEVKRLIYNCFKL